MSNYQKYQEASTTTNATNTHNNDSRCWEYTMIGRVFASEERPWFYTQDNPPPSSGISYTRWADFQTLLSEKKKHRHIRTNLWKLFTTVPCMIVMAILYTLLTEVIIPSMSDEVAQTICLITLVPLLCYYVYVKYSFLNKWKYKPSKMRLTK